MHQIPLAIESVEVLHFARRWHLALLSPRHFGLCLQIAVVAAAAAQPASVPIDARRPSAAVVPVELQQTKKSDPVDQSTLVGLQEPDARKLDLQDHKGYRNKKGISSQP